MDTLTHTVLLVRFFFCVMNIDRRAFNGTSLQLSPTNSTALSPRIHGVSKIFSADHETHRKTLVKPDLIELGLPVGFRATSYSI